MAAADDASCVLDEVSGGLQMNAMAANILSGHHPVRPH